MSEVNDQFMKPIRFTAKLYRPDTPANATWLFLILPKKSSAKLPSRSRVSVKGSINGVDLKATFEPDGKGSHWLKLNRQMCAALARNAERNLKAGDPVLLEIIPLTPDQEPEPKVPADLRKALDAAAQKAKEVWADITPIARRDFVHWIESAKQDATRARRVRTACDMLAKGKRRPCCFDRSGMYDNSLCCPTPASLTSGSKTKSK